MAIISNLKREALVVIMGKFAEFRVGVYGDHCLDRYMVGRMEAISRDAPVPIVRLQEDRHSPGGGGNVAMNLRALGAQVFALGTVGGDLSAEVLRRCYREAGIDESSLYGVPDRFTITFSKLYATAAHGSPQQVARFDRENTQPLPRSAEEEVLRAMDLVVPQLDAVVVCDYEEVADTGSVTSGALARLHALARKHRVVLAADSRMRIMEMGPVDLAVPNDLEAAAGANMVDLSHRGEISPEIVERAGEKLSTEAGIRHVVITRGEKGMAVFESGRKLADAPAPPARGEIDVTGAGDSVLAAITLAHIGGLHIVKAAAFANLAAHVTIHKLNTTGTADPEELLQAFDRLA